MTACSSPSKNPPQRARRRGVRRWGWATLAASALGWGCEERPAGGALAMRGVIGEPGANPGQFSYPRCLDADAGSIWVIDKLARVSRLDSATGSYIEGWRMPRFANGKPTGVTVWTPRTPGDDQYLFVADTHEHRVMVYRVSRDPARPRGEELVASFGRYGRADGEFVFLTDVAVETDEGGGAVRRLYVSEYGGNDRVSVFTREGDNTPAGGTYAFAFSFGRFGSGAGPDPVEFSRPQSLAFDHATRELIVCDSCNHRIGRFTPEGRLIAWMGNPVGAGREPGEFDTPYGLALLGDGTALVSEYTNCRVQRIELATGACVGVGGAPGRGPGLLGSPWGVAASGSRGFVLDSMGNRVQRFDVGDLARPRGTRLAARGSDGVGGSSIGGSR